MVFCPECGSDMIHVYTEYQIERAIKEIKNPMEKASVEFKMRREFICTKQDCSFIKKLSSVDIVQEYARVRRDEGISDNEILKEVNEKIGEAQNEKEKVDSK